MAKDNILVGNPFGAALSQGVVTQIKQRGVLLGKSNKSDQELLLQNSNTGWVKLSSGINIDNSPELAKNNILFGGVLYQEASAFKLRQGFSTESYTNSKAAYSNNPSDKGFRPIPGIKGANISSEGSYGSLVKAKISFVVHDFDQFELFESLYMKLGSFMLLEWGNSVYCDTNKGGNSITSDISTVQNFFGDKVSQANIESQIIELQEKTSFNYDGFIGTLSKFSYKFNPEGSYECDIELTGKGAIIEALSATGSPRPTKSGPGKNQISIDTGANVVVDESGNITKKEVDSIENTSPIAAICNTMLQLAPNESPNDTVIDRLKQEWPNMKWEDTHRPLFLCKANQNDVEVNMVYIKLKTWIKILNDTLLPTCNEGEKFIKFDYSSETSSQFISYDNHFSLNPNICILPKKPVNENLDIGYRKRNLLVSNDDTNLYNIWLNVNMVSDTLSEMGASQEDGQVDLVDYISTVLDKVSTSIGGYNDFQLAFNPNNSNYIIVDAKLTTQGRNIARAVINLTGLESTVSDVSIQSDTSSRIASMLAIQSSDPKLMKIHDGAMGKYAGKSSDRLKAVTTATVGAEKDDDGEPKPSPKEQLEKATTAFIGERQILDDVTSLISTHIDVTSAELNKVYKGSPPSRLPIKLSLTLDGISGILPLQKFKIEGGVLPDFITKDMAFQVTKVGHKFDNNKWKTDLDTILGYTQSLEMAKGQSTELGWDKPLNQEIVDIIEAEKNNPPKSET